MMSDALEIGADGSGELLGEGEEVGGGRSFGSFVRVGLRDGVG
jgi:hypothetical protein